MKNQEEQQVRQILADTYTNELAGAVFESQPQLAAIHRFGVRQNVFNGSAEERIAVIQDVCRRQQREINALREENRKLRMQVKQNQQREQELFQRIAADMKVMQNEINRIRLSTHLNNAAIERLSQGTDTAEEQQALIQEPLEEQDMLVSEEVPEISMEEDA